MTTEFDTYYDAIDLARDSVARAFTMMVRDRSDVSVAAYETALDAQKSARDGLGRAIREKDAREFKAAGLPCTARATRPASTHKGETEMTDTLYDKAGTAFAPDHEANGKVYVRPMIRVVMQSTNYSGDDFHESEDFEPAPYLIAMDRADLFDAPPVSQVNADIAAARATLKSIQADAAKEARRLRAERNSAENELRTAQRQLAEWMTKHQPMIELGKLLDGKVLFPLSVAENRYHGGREIPSIPKMSEIGRLEVLSGNFEKGQAWKFKRHLSDHYGSPFRFYDTDADRSAVIASEFADTCTLFRKHPNFDTTSHTSGTTLHYGTLTKWVECHPALSIPEDIEAMKLENDARLYDARRAKLAAELAALDHPA